ncbi:MAG: hypothetical protein OHK0013_40260 [Sandaracinaceae bacterium]
MARGRARRLERSSDAPSDPPESERARAARSFALGCGLTSLAVVLFGGLLGLVVFGMIRFGGDRPGRGDDDESATVEDEDGLPVPRHDPGPDPTQPSTQLDPLAEMRRRYVPGPHVRIEGMIPSDRAYAAQGAVSPWQSARSADTPWLVLGATYRREAAPGASPIAAPTVLHAPGEPVQRPIDLIPHVPVVARVAAADGTGGPDVMHYLVSFDGYPGHFSLPVRVQTELGPVAAGGSEGAAIRFTIGSAQRPDRSFLGRGQSYLATMRIQAVDSAGRVSAPVTRQVNVLPLGQGDLEVAMTMALPTDLDLYVTDPAGTTVYYGNDEGFSGGRLDLDANAACSGNMGVQAEHIYWPSGAAPAGTYSVRVAHFESCVGGQPVDYRVTVRACGETVVLTGRFTGMGRGTACTGRADDPGWCQEVVTFQLPSCRVSN